MKFHAPRLPRACRSVVIAMADTPHIESRIQALLKTGVQRTPPHILPALAVFGAATITLAGVRAEERSAAVETVLPPHRQPMSGFEPTRFGVFADGVTIDVIAIGSKDGKRWWTPTGEPFEPTKGPYAAEATLLNERFHPNPPPSLGGSYCRVLVRELYPPTETPMTRIVNAGDSYQGWFSLTRNGMSRFSIVAAAVSNGATGVSMQVANGSWKERASWRPGDPARRDYPANLGAPSRVFPEPVVFFAPRPAVSYEGKPRPGSEVWVQDHFGQENALVFLIDRTGREQSQLGPLASWREGGIWHRTSCAGFPTVKLEEIASVSFRTRPYRTFTVANLPAAPVSR